MDNPQPKVTDVEAGWFAGFFDGEGTVALGIRATGGKNGAPKVYPLSMVTNTHVGVLDVVTSILDRAECAYHVGWVQPKGYTKDGRLFKQAWTIHISGQKRVKRFLQWITPLLHIKRERAETTLDYIRLRERHTDHRTPIKEDEIALALKMKELNRKGGKAVRYDKALKLNTERPGASSEVLAANGRKGAEARWGVRY